MAVVKIRIHVSYDGEEKFFLISPEGEKEITKEEYEELRRKASYSESPFYERVGVSVPYVQTVYLYFWED